MHVKFFATVHHENSNSTTEYIALSKVPETRKSGFRKTNYLHHVEIDTLPNSSYDFQPKYKLFYDLEWLSVVRKTQEFYHCDGEIPYIPKKQSFEISVYSLKNEALETLL